MWLRWYVIIMAFLVVTALLYAGLLPSMVSAADSISVGIGLILAVSWPVFCVWFIHRQFRKKNKCVKF